MGSDNEKIYARGGNRTLMPACRRAGIAPHAPPVCLPLGGIDALENPPSSSSPVHSRSSATSHGAEPLPESQTLPQKPHQKADTPECSGFAPPDAREPADQYYSFTLHTNISGSDFLIRTQNTYEKFMREEGIEPSWIAPHAPQTCASTNSATRAKLQPGTSLVNLPLRPQVSPPRKRPHRPPQTL